jgi:hypothetical protein
VSCAVEPRLGPGKRLWHCTIMPCPDKKLESARPELSVDGRGQETDCVLTAAELMHLVEQEHVSLSTLPRGRLDSLSSVLSTGTTGLTIRNYSAHELHMQTEEAEMVVAPGALLFLCLVQSFCQVLLWTAYHRIHTWNHLVEQIQLPKKCVMQVFVREATSKLSHGTRPGSFWG